MSGYETRDIRVRPIALGLGGLIVLLAAVALVSAAALGAWSSFVPARRRLPPPAPRLQSDPAVDLIRERGEEEARLERAAWIDRKRGVVRLPIERAMTLLLLRGLPTRPARPRP